MTENSATMLKKILVNRNFLADSESPADRVIPCQGWLVFKIFAFWKENMSIVRTFSRKKTYNGWGLCLIKKYIVLCCGL